MVCLTLQGLGQIPKTKLPKLGSRVVGFHTRQVSQSLTPITSLHLGRQGKIPPLLYHIYRILGSYLCGGISFLSSLSADICSPL